MANAILIRIVIMFNRYLLWSDNGMHLSVLYSVLEWSHIVILCSRIKAHHVKFCSWLIAYHVIFCSSVIGPVILFSNYRVMLHLVLESSHIMLYCSSVIALHVIFCSAIAHNVIFSSRIIAHVIFRSWVMCGSRYACSQPSLPSYFRVTAFTHVHSHTTLFSRHSSSWHP